MHIDVYNALVDKAKTKKDGVYSYRGMYYAVKNCRLVGHCDYYGNVFENAYGFNVVKGKARNKYEGRDVLKSYLTQLT